MDEILSNCMINGIPSLALAPITEKQITFNTVSDRLYPDYKNMLHFNLTDGKSPSFRWGMGVGTVRIQ